MTNKPTDEQQRVIASPPQAICVNASAGTGKTSTLIKRIIQLVGTPGAPVPLANILAITFTEKAAREIKERLSAALQAQNLPVQELASAYISTFHGMCARILRENWLPAGLAPHFDILTEIPAEILLEKSINEAIYENLSADNTAILELLNHYPRAKLVENLRAVLPAIQASGQTSAGLLTDPQSILANIRRYNEKYWQAIYPDLRQRLNALSQKRAEKSVENSRLQLVALLGQEF